MKELQTYLSICLVIISFSALSQERETDPGWQWGKVLDIVNGFRSNGIKTDSENNIISFFSYQDSVHIEDTAFYHPEGYPSGPYKYFTIVKRNSKGDFIKAIDFHACPGGNLYPAQIELDNESNIYVYGRFKDTLFVNDTFIVSPYSNYSDVYLLKIDKDFEFLWSRVIYSEFQDDNRGIAISDDNYIYITSLLVYGSYDTNNYKVIYFDQDSSVYFTGLNSLLKIDPDGHLVWRSEIRDPYYGSADIRNTIVGKDGLIYVIGNSTVDFYVQDDTIKHPTYPEYYNMEFIIRFDTAGQHQAAFFNPYKYVSIGAPGFRIDENGNYFISSIIFQSALFGSDSILLTNDTIYSMLAKLDSNFVPIWNEGVKSKNDFTIFQLEIVNDSVAFAFQGMNRFIFMDQKYILNAASQVFLGLFNAEGELIDLQSTDANAAELDRFQVDNCGNLMIEGFLRGIAHFGNDTIDAGVNYLRYFAKNSRNNQLPLDLPADTTGCYSVKLFAPDGFSHYRWNGVLTDQNWFIVYSSGTVHLEAADENCCWREAVIEVTIWPAIVFSLGNDTTIRMTDTLILSSIPGYESYLWSTGDTTPNISIPANLLQIGINQIWLEISDGHCFASDTINIIVIDNSSIDENAGKSIMLAPNPAMSYVQIFSNPGMIPERVVFYNLIGTKVLDLRPCGNKIDISFLEPGIYIVELSFKNNILRRKLVIN